VTGKKKTVHGAGGIQTQIAQVYTDYSSLPARDAITLDEVRFFYEAVIDGLCKLQKGK
jgi:polyphosphate kinase